MTHLKSAVGLSALIIAMVPVAFGDETAGNTEIPAIEDGIQTFEAPYFARYNPVTAADMVARVPGFEVNAGEDRRGFGGTASNILVNGERPSSKDDINEQLKRIPAGSVARLELISGSAGNVDVRGQTQLVNVVLKETVAGGSPTTFVLEARDIQYSERVGYTIQLTKTFSLWDNADLTLDFQTPNLGGRGESYEESRAPDGTLVGYRDTFGQPEQQGIQISGAFGWKPTETDTINLNARYRPMWNTQIIGVQTYSPTDVRQAIIAGETDFRDNFSIEMGGDWEHQFGSNLSAKLIGLFSQAGVDQADRYRTFLPTGLFRTQTINRETERGERVARAFMSWKATPSHTIDFGVEGAFNFRDTTLDIFNDTGSGPVPQFLAVADARVEEVRAEPFITDVWRISDKLSLETGFVFEVSRITQTGDEEKEREFSYPKPRVIATWQASPDDQLRFSLERDVGQLDFTQFASSLNVVDAFSILGNPDLEPEKAWKYRAEWEKRFGDRGAVTLALFHDQVQDVEDLIVIGNGDAYGNLGDGTRTGFEVRGTTRLNEIIPRSELRYSGKWQETSVTDPITGEDRRFAGERDWTYDVSFRQELPTWKSAWGVSTSRKADLFEFKRIEDVRDSTPNDLVTIFFETTKFFGVTTRLEAVNIFHTEQYRTRTFYADDPSDPTAPPRNTGVIEQIDYRKSKGGPNGTQIFKFRVSGTF